MWEEGSYFSLSPTCFETKSEEEIEKKVAFTALAVAKTGKCRPKGENGVLVICRGMKWKAAYLLLDGSFRSQEAKQ